MLKVFLVEDEIVMREGIKNHVEWEKEGFEFAGEASDGELAFPMIQNVKPDILITDIKMPFMDGLELSRLVKKEQPDIKIVILSGFDEFQFAKQAIEIGVTDYILKPVTSSQLLEKLHRIADGIEEEKSREKTALFIEQEESLQSDQRRLFRKLVEGRASMSDILEQGQKLHMDLIAESYEIVLFQMRPKHVEQNLIGTYSEQMVKAYEEIGEYVGGQDGIQMYEQLGEVLAFLLLSKSRDQISYLQDSLLDQIKKISEKYEDMLYFIGVGNPKNHIREIWYSYEQASSVFSHRFMESQSRVYFYSTEREDDIDIGGMDVGKLDRKVLKNFLSTGEKNELDSFLNEYFQSLGEANLKSTFFRQYIVTDVYFTVVALLEEVHATKEQAMAICGSVKDGAKSLGNLEETKTYVRELLLKVMDARAQMAKQKYGSMIQDAKEYIHANYNDEGMSLNQVAAYVNVSPNHFSTVFRQETGENFIEYLTSVRLEHAKEMLRTTSRKTSEIGYEVGYKDPHYFSSLFKKVEGMTPKEYRGGNVG